MATNPKDPGILLAAGTNEVEFLLIKLGKQRYGINVSKICAIQVFDPERVSPIPNQPKEMIGIMQFREKTISLVDLSASLMWNDVLQECNRRLLVVAEFNQRTTGFVVDEVDRIERFGWPQFEPITDTTCNGGSSSILGTIRTSEGLILIIDLETIMAELDPTMSIEHFAPAIAGETVSRSSIRVLHLDDSPLIQRIVGDVLAKAGFQDLHQVSNGEEALTFLKENGQDSVDIIISDIEMPKMDGLSFCKTMRTELKMNEIPLLFFSSLITEPMLVKCKTVGGDGAFSKPQINMIVSEIERLIIEKRNSAG